MSEPLPELPEHWQYMNVKKDGKWKPYPYSIFRCDEAVVSRDHGDDGMQLKDHWIISGPELDPDETVKQWRRRFKSVEAAIAAANEQWPLQKCCCTVCAEVANG